MLIFGGFSLSPQRHEYDSSQSSSSSSPSPSYSSSSSNALYRFSFESRKWNLIVPHVNSKLVGGKLGEPQHRFFHSCTSCLIDIYCLYETNI
jgi:hypothetical protein